MLVVSKRPKNLVKANKRQRGQDNLLNPEPQPAQKHSKTEAQMWSSSGIVVYDYK